MNIALLKQAAETLKKVDWDAAQRSEDVGYVSPLVDIKADFKPSRGPATSGMSNGNSTKGSQDNNTYNRSRKPKAKKSNKAAPEMTIPMTPEVAQELNASLQDTDTPYWKRWSTPNWSPWHAGYSRVPNTVPPDKKNPELHDEEAFQKIFGPRHSDWRQDNPAGWFNFSTASKDGMFDEYAFWDDYTKQYSPYQVGPYRLYAPIEIVAPLESISGDEPAIQEEQKSPQQAWEEFAQENPSAFEQVREDIIRQARLPSEKHNPHENGPFTTIDETWEGDQIHPYNSMIRFPHQDDITLGYTKPLTPQETETSFLGLAPADLFPPYAPMTESTGAHEGTHNITFSLANEPANGLTPYVAGLTGIYPWLGEIPTINTEAFYNTNGRFVPEITPTMPPKPMRLEGDEYLRFIYPTADSIRVSHSGEVDPKFINPEIKVDEFENMVDPKALYSRGIRYWNGPHEETREPDNLRKLRFIPDHPTGQYYDRFGNRRLSGGELANYNDLWGDMAPKDMEQLPPNFRRNLENLGKAPQAWIDAIDHPEDYAAAQDRVRRLLFPLLRKDISGMFRDGDLESMKLLKDYQHPAFQMLVDALNGRVFFDLTDQERSEIMDKVEALYPELRLDPVATPSYLIEAQRQFGMLPEMGVTGVRTLDQYNDIARYIEYYRALEEYMRQYSPQGGGQLGA